jgi:hypothetical protein
LIDFPTDISADVDPRRADPELISDYVDPLLAVLVTLWFSINHKHLEQDGRKTKTYGTDQPTDSFTPTGYWYQNHCPRAWSEQKHGKGLSKEGCGT